MFINLHTAIGTGLKEKKPIKKKEKAKRAVLNATKTKGVSKRLAIKYIQTLLTHYKTLRQTRL